MQKYHLEDHRLAEEGEEVEVEEVVEAPWGVCLLVVFLVYLAKLVQPITEVSV